MYIQVSTQEVADMMRKKFPSATDIRLVIKCENTQTWFFDIDQSNHRVRDSREVKSNV